MSGYIGIGNRARKIKNCYIGVAGKARKIKKMYIGIGGKARLFYYSVRLPQNISGKYTGTNSASGVQVAEFTVTDACRCTIALTNISINYGSSAKVSVLNIIGSDGKSVCGIGNSSATDHPSSLTGSGALAPDNYKVTVQCFGVTGSQSGTSYYAGSMNYSIEFFET